MATTNGVDKTANHYSPAKESRRILELLTSKPELRLPPEVFSRHPVSFSSDGGKILFPIPFKETETAAALKAIEAGIAAQLAELRYAGSTVGEMESSLRK